MSPDAAAPGTAGAGPRLALAILRYRLRAQRRALAADAFPILVLGPLIAGGALWVADLYLGLARAGLAALLASGGRPGVPDGGALGYGAALLLTALALPAAQRELFPVRSPGGYLDALPVPESVRFHVALAACWSRQLPVCGVLLATLYALADGAATAAELVAWTLRLLAAVVPATLIAMAAAQARVRLGTLRSGGGRLLAATAALAGALWLLPPGVRLHLLLPWRATAAQLETVMGEALAVPVPSSAAALAATVAALYAGAGWLFVRFRRRDLERAEHLFRSAAAGELRLRLLRGRRSPLRTQLTRDLLLIGRRFSGAVYLAAALAVLAVAATVLLLPGLDLAPPWPRRLAIIGSLVAVLVLVALVPLLLRHQLPRFWLEKSTGVAPEEIWRVKVWLARVLALPGVVAGAALLGSLPGDGWWIAVLQLLAGSWIVASVVGLAAFEIAEHPVLGLAFSALVGLALAALFVLYADVWWLWGTFYVVVAGKLGERASVRVRLLEVAA